MKQVRFLLAALLLMVCGIAANAQKVVVYKTDGTKVEYKASEVDSVAYEPKKIINPEDILGYYGTVDDELYNDPNITPEIAAGYEPLTAKVSEVTATNHVFAIVLSPNNTKPGIEYSSFNGWNVVPSSAIEVPTDTAPSYSNTVTVNGKTYYIFITSTKFATANQWRFTLN